MAVKTEPGLQTRVAREVCLSAHLSQTVNKPPNRENPKIITRKNGLFRAAILNFITAIFLRNPLITKGFHLLHKTHATVSIYADAWVLLVFGVFLTSVSVSKKSF